MSSIPKADLVVVYRKVTVTGAMWVEVMTLRMLEAFRGAGVLFPRCRYDESLLYVASQAMPGVDHHCLFLPGASLTHDNSVSHIHFVDVGAMDRWCAKLETTIQLFDTPDDVRGTPAIEFSLPTEKGWTIVGSVVRNRISVNTAGKTGVDLIAEERKSQLKRRSAAHDAEHTSGELAQGAACYAVPNLYLCRQDAEWGAIQFYPAWPWHPREDPRSENTRVHNLVKFGAMIAAELDRLQQTPCGTCVRASSCCADCKHGTKK